MSNNDYLELAERLECIVMEITFTGEIDERCHDSLRYIISQMRGEEVSPYLVSLYSKGVH